MHYMIDPMPTTARIETEAVENHRICNLFGRYTWTSKGVTVVWVAVLESTKSCVLSTLG